MNQHRARQPHKTATSATYHAFNFRKYGRRYLAEAQYRFNRRLFLSAILRCFLYAVAATGGELTLRSGWQMT